MQVPPESCATCYHAFSENAQLFCRRHPPTVFPIPAKNMMTGEATMQLASFHPVVRPEQVCGEYDDGEGAE